MELVKEKASYFLVVTCCGPRFRNCARPWRARSANIIACCLERYWEQFQSLEEQLGKAGAEIARRISLTLPRMLTAHRAVNDDSCCHKTSGSN
jgi:hypothetical protein